MSEGCLEGVGKLSGSCQEGSGRCLEDVKKVLKSMKNHNGSEGQARTGVARTGQVRTSQDNSGHDRFIQERSS